MLSCVLFEDEHLLVVNKPAGLNTHAPDPCAGEGIYDWLRHREARWADLAIIHRLDKETSGVMVFGKTAAANRSLTRQFTSHGVQKRYFLLTEGKPPRPTFTCRSVITRAGDRYVSRPEAAGGQVAETQFRVLPESELQRLVGDSGVRRRLGGLTLVEARPLTGRTHQIRVHAAANGVPVLGDTLYGGAPAERVYLHATEIRLAHPVTGEKVAFSAEFPMGGDPRQDLRAAVIEPDLTDCYRLVHGGSDGWGGMYVDRLGDYLLAQLLQKLRPNEIALLERLGRSVGARGVYQKVLSREARVSGVKDSSPQLAMGENVAGEFQVRENGVRYLLSFEEGYSVGLFLDQRENRRRFLSGHVGAGFGLWGTGKEVLNTFAYTCGFSVCAALGGARTTSVDLSRKYLEWGRRHFAVNGLDAGGHEFIYGDVFDWLRRLGRKGRRFDVVVTDPPTFSQSKVSGVFRAEKDYGKLVRAAVGVLKPGGVLFVSCNAAGWPAVSFLEAVRRGVADAGRQIQREYYAPQPPDFPISRAEPGYLKTVWLRVA